MGKRKIPPEEASSGGLCSVAVSHLDDMETERAPSSPEDPPPSIVASAVRKVGRRDRGQVAARAGIVAQAGQFVDVVRHNTRVQRIHAGRMFGPDHRDFLLFWPSGRLMVTPRKSRGEPVHVVRRFEISFWLMRQNLDMRGRYGGKPAMRARQREQHFYHSIL